MKYIVIPLFVLMIMAFASSLGMQEGGVTWGNIDFSASGEVETFYDIGGHPICFSNLTACGESGSIVAVSLMNHPGDFLDHSETEYAFWNNNTSYDVFAIGSATYWNGTSTITVWELYRNGGSHIRSGWARIVDGQNLLEPDPDMIKFSEVNGLLYSTGGTSGLSFSIGSSVGIIAIVIAIIALAAIVGLRIVSSGISDESISAILKGTAFLAFWGIFSTMALPLITMIPLFIGVAFYFGLTFFYALGVINSIGSPSEED